MYNIYIFIIWQTQSLCSDWFFLGQDFAVRTVSTRVFLFRSEAGNLKFATKTAKKKLNIVTLQSETTRRS